VILVAVTPGALLPPPLLPLLPPLLLLLDEPQAAIAIAARVGSTT
jgi:hypothetical protein